MRLAVCTEGLLVKVPVLDGRLQQSVRNTFFHVPMWFGMMVCYTISVIYGLLYLAKQKPGYDHTLLNLRAPAPCLAFWGLLPVLYGLTTNGALPGVVTLNKTGLPLPYLFTLAYFVLRGSINDVDRRYRIRRRI